ncbi:TetR family transcriptional regulator C-terminal domain-containing protein [Nocardia sp. NPDC004722]
MPARPRSCRHPSFRALVDYTAREINTGMNERLAELLRELLERLVETRHLLPDFDLDLEDARLHVLFDGIAQHAVTDPDRMPPDKVDCCCEPLRSADPASRRKPARSTKRVTFGPARDAPVKSGLTCGAHVTDDRSPLPLPAATPAPPGSVCAAVEGRRAWRPRNIDDNLTDPERYRHSNTHDLYRHQLRRSVTAHRSVQCYRALECARGPASNSAGRYGWPVGR